MQQSSTSARGAEDLRLTLSKIYPLERWEVATEADQQNPVAPRFCWQFFRPDPDVYHRIEKVLKSFRGHTRWILWGSGCIAATGLGPGFTAYPHIGTNDLNSLDKLATILSPSSESINAAFSDLPALCAHIETVLHLQEVAPKTFDPDWIAPTEPPSMDSEPIDFLEPGMQVAWIVASPNEFARIYPHEPLNTSKPLHFGVTEKERQLIYRDVLGGVYLNDLTAKVVEAGPHESQVYPGAPGYPLLSRIHADESSVFGASEIAGLRVECLHARSGTSLPTAIRGLDKLILICNWAIKLKRGVYLMGP